MSLKQYPVPVPLLLITTLELGQHPVGNCAVFAEVFVTLKETLF
jgi:hypothetical protein